MKTIEFKKLPKALKEEGITFDLLERVQRIEKKSPVQFVVGEEPVMLVRCNAESYFVLLADGSYLKEGKNLIKYDLKTCIIARARYLLHNEVAEIESEIQIEVNKIKAVLTKKAQHIISQIDLLFQMADYDPNAPKLGFSQMLSSLNSSAYEICRQNEKERALEIIEANSREYYEYLRSRINELLTSENFEQLYIILEANGLPLIAQFDTKNDEELDLLRVLFHKENIDYTVASMAYKSYLEQVAMVRVKKRYL